MTMSFRSWLICWKWRRKGPSDTKQRQIQYLRHCESNVYRQVFMRMPGWQLAEIHFCKWILPLLFYNKVCDMSTYLNKNITYVRRDNFTTPDWSKISLTLKLPLTNSKDSIEPNVQILLISFSIESLKISFLHLFE